MSIFRRLSFLFPAFRGRIPAWSCIDGMEESSFDKDPWIWICFFLFFLAFILARS
jgi:hypothetical protein